MVIGSTGMRRLLGKLLNIFQSLFNLTLPAINTSTQDYIPSCISGGDNGMSIRIPDEKEIKDVVFSLSSHSTAGPDGFSGTFFQSC